MDGNEKKYINVGNAYQSEPYAYHTESWDYEGDDDFKALFIVEGKDNLFYVEQISTRPGYIKASEPQVVNLNKKDQVETVTFINEIVKFNISIKDNNNNDLPGKPISIIDEDGEVLRNCVFSNVNGNIVVSYTNDSSAQNCSWVTNDKPSVIEGFPEGEYYIKDNNDSNSEPTQITVTENGAYPSSVNIVDDNNTPVENTLVERKSVFIIVAMINIALIIGIIVYIKKIKYSKNSGSMSSSVGGTKN